MLTVNVILLQALKSSAITQSTPTKQTEKRLLNTGTNSFDKLNAGQEAKEDKVSEKVFEEKTLSETNKRPLKRIGKRH